MNTGIYREGDKTGYINTVLRKVFPRQVSIQVNILI
jgi:hypothetical protein